MLWAAWFHTFLPHFCHFSPPVSQCAVGALGRMILLVSDFSPTCLRLVCHSLEALGRMVLQLFPTHLPVCCRCSGPHEPTLLSHIRSRRSGPPESKLVSLVSHLSPTVSGPHGSALVSHLSVDALGRMVLRLYPAGLPLVSDSAGAPGHTCFCTCLPLFYPFLPHLSPGCPPLDSHCLEVRCGCSGPHESTLVSRAVGALSNLHLSPSCLPLPGSALDQLSPSWVPGSPLSKKGVDALDLLILDLSPTCLPVCCRCPGPE